MHLGLSSKSPWHGTLSLSHPSLCLAPCPGGMGGGREEGCSEGVRLVDSGSAPDQGGLEC